MVNTSYMIDTFGALDDTSSYVHYFQVSFDRFVQDSFLIYLDHSSLREQYLLKIGYYDHLGSHWKLLVSSKTTSFHLYDKAHLYFLHLICDVHCYAKVAFLEAVDELCLCRSKPY